MFRNIQKYFITILLTCFISCLSACQPQKLFRHRWWNYYERGTSFMEGNLLNPAEADFREALKQWDRDERRARTYGFHFIDYFPHRELGIVLFHRGQYSEAIRELEISLSTAESSKAKYYLNKSREVMIRQQSLDHAPPEIMIDTPKHGTISNAFSIVVSGTAKDDTFVREVRVNGNLYRIDLAASQIPFNVEVPIHVGENVISVESTDLSGKSSSSTLKVFCDRIGPVLNIDGITEIDASGHRYKISGHAYDDSGIKAVRLNGLPIATNPSASDVVLNHDVVITNKLQPITIQAVDRAGNQTTAEIPNPNQALQENIDDVGKICLASLDTFPFSGEFATDSSSSFPTPYRNILALNDQERGKIVNSKQTPNPTLGEYNALIIGIDDYEEWTPLQTAVNDAAAIKDILTSRYGFAEDNVTLLTNKDATREAIYQNVITLATSLTENDNLLIYYAGHGILDKKANDGYWIPVDGKRGQSNWTWIAHSTIKNLITSDEVKGKNIVVIVDSCYGGKLLRGDESAISVDEANYNSKILRLATKKSRQIITSGSLEVVADWGRDNHSLFAYYFLKALNDNTRALIDLKTLFMDQVFKFVSEKGDQRPMIGRLNTPMDEDGEFVLTQTPPPTSTPADSSVEIAGVASENFRTPEPSVTDTQLPVIEMKRWENHQTVYIDKAYLNGRVYDDTSIKSLTINGFHVIHRSGKNIYFHYLTDLAEGNNLFLIECIDRSGNRTVKEINIYRKIQPIYLETSRMSTALLMEGDQHAEIKGSIFRFLVDSSRFHMKDLNSAQIEQLNTKEAARELNVEFKFKGSIVKKENSIEITLQVIEMETSTVLTYVDVYGEDMTPDFIRQLCKGLVIKLQDEFPLIEGKIVAIKGDDVIVNLGEEHRLKKGMHLIFFKKGEPVIDSDTGEVLIEETIEEIGTMRIEKLLEKASYASIYHPETPPKLEKGLFVVTK